jgi:hypothetical protein
MKTKLELKDWVDMETQAEESIRSGERMIVLGEMMLTRAVKEIKNLGGHTAEEIRENARNTTV